MVQRYRQEQDYYSLLAQLYPSGGKEKQNAFDKYRQAAFPYVEKGAEDHQNRIRAILDKAYLQGAMVIKKDK